MEPFATAVKNVRVYPYIPDAPIEVPPVLENGSGKFSVGTLTTHIFYNLSLTNGTPRNGGVHAGVRYYALYDTDTSKNQQTPWLTCLQGGEQPRFGRTIDALASSVGQTQTVGATSPQPDIALRLHLSNINVNMYVDPIEPLEIQLITGGHGIASYLGLLPGASWTVGVEGGTRVNPLVVGTKVTINGINVATGRRFDLPAVLRTTDAGDPAVFVSQPPRS